MPTTKVVTKYVMKNNKATQIANSLSLRYCIPPLDCGNWTELRLFGGVGMDPQTFGALAAAALAQGDALATVYELETLAVEFPPIPVRLDFESFNQLKGHTALLFEVALLPKSQKWVALLTDELETFVYGTADFLDDVSRRTPENMQRC